MYETEFWGQAIPLLFVLAVLYVMVIRPPRVIENQRFRSVQSLVGGEKVVTQEGMIGRVVSAKPGKDLFEVEVASGVVVTLGQRGIAEVRGIPDPEARPDAEDACIRLAKEWSIVPSDGNLLPWRNGRDITLVLFHRPGRERIGARLPRKWLGYPVKAIAAPAELLAPDADAAPESAAETRE